MSNLILTACRPIQVPLTAKCVLLALADRADELGRCWPSLEDLEQHTCASRRSVMEALKQLEHCRAIAVDRSRRNHVYTVTPALFEPSEKLISTRTAARKLAMTQANAAPFDPATGANAAPFGLPKEADAAPVESSTGADAASSGADAAPEQVQMPPPMVQMPHPKHQEASTEASIKQQRVDKNDFDLTAQIGETPKRSKAAGFDAGEIELPAWLGREDWAMWVRDRKGRKKPITADAARLQIQSLDKLRSLGHSPAAVIQHAIASGYQGLYPPPKSSRPDSGRAFAHRGTDQRNYEEDFDGKTIT
ncbi:hypothetical protein J2W32_004447 [Variovorax boronicumulans]|uniref:Helix-turn-helix domain-containing protein n=1 Tax=Variovorax boronicumulans TaxID=436515 RepID=A0AAW8D4D8_9BURK|nr:helix-turn-helix domain-containing protein [Variovorax boronicumulans]MDP9895349.1 hypothetical protein [Variovorax boronicumulans]MDQ0055389.1 hypothetical protein [Variovorax boronicumulans]